MRSLYHFIRLTRPLNLVVIALTMGVFHFFLSKYQGLFDAIRYQDPSVRAAAEQWSKDGFSYPFLHADFLLLLLSTLLIAAAGNIINDYFDVRADRINKPDHLIIDVHIKRRVAILWNWIFNLAGLMIAVYLSWKLANWWIALIAFVSINTLWFYSMYFKRTFLLGNLFVALLTAIVPVYVLIFYLPLQTVTIPVTAANAVDLPPKLIIFPTLAIAMVAFFLNLSREIIKDIADVRGDLLLKAQTIPIRWGIKKAKWVLFILLIPLAVTILLYGLFSWEIDFYMNNGSMGFPGYHPPLIPVRYYYFSLLGLCAVVFITVAYFVLLVSNKRKFYILSSNLLKVAMFFGLLTPLFL